MEDTNTLPLQKAVDLFDKITCKPEKFLSVQEQVSEDAKLLGKLLYDFTKHEEDKATTNALPSLIINDFDEEQIWQEIELQNDDKWNGFLSSVSTLLTQKKSLNFPVKIDQSESDIELNGDAGSSDESEIDIPKPTVKEKSKLKDVRKKKNSRVPKQKKGSIVDDRFFKLSEMEAFLDAQDKMEMKKSKPTKIKTKKKGEESSEEEDDDDESIDLFADIDDEDSEGEGIPEMKYCDFFGKDSQGDSSNEGNEGSDDEYQDDENQDEEMSDAKEPEAGSDNEIDSNKGKGKNKKVRFSMPQSSSDDEDSSANENVDDEENQTEFEKRQQRLKKKIGHLENSLLEEKSWPMKGEVTGPNRPQNSLLEEVVDFDITSRPAPIITEETTMKLQDIIIQRIKDKAWDDVIRKMKPVKEVQEFKKELVLDQEKSKLSLAQVYEQDYIKQREALEPDADEKPEEVPKEHEEIKTMMMSLFTKLDALSNFHYTPKVVAPDVKIVSNIPAITMEEVAPVATSDATLLAPEEVKAKLKGDIIGKSERTDTDKKRERRQKKLKQREREKERQKKEKLLDKMHPGLGNKYSREKASKLLDKVTKDRNVDKMETLGDGKSIKSSKAFFTQLQDEVSGSIKSKIKSFNKKNKNVISAKKVKL